MYVHFEFSFHEIYLCHWFSYFQVFLRIYFSDVNNVPARFDLSSSNAARFKPATRLRYLFLLKVHVVGYLYYWVLLLVISAFCNLSLVFVLFVTNCACFDITCTVS